MVETLQQKFPDVPKTKLRQKVREISDFEDSRWQVSYFDLSHNNSCVWLETELLILQLCNEYYR